MLYTYLLYYGVAAVSCLSALMAQKDRNKEFTIWKRKINRSVLWLILAAIPLICMTGFRWETGIDHQNYYWLFTNIHYNIENHAEVGFYLLSQLIFYFTEDMSVLFFLCAAITVGMTLLAIYRNSDHYFISVFLYITMGFYLYSMNSMRHFMALSIFLFGYQYLKKRQFFRYLICILAASTFHKIALIAIPLYFLLPIRFKIYWYAIFAGGLFVISLFHRQILDMLYHFVFGFYKNIEASLVSVSWVNIFITLCLSLLAFYYRKQLLKRNPLNILLMNAAYFGLIFFVTCSWIPQYTRIGQYLTILSLFLVPELFACEERVQVKKIYFAGLLAGFTIFFGMIIWNGQKPNIKLAPYQSVFSRTEYELGSFWFLPPNK